MVAWEHNALLGSEGESEMHTLSVTVDWGFLSPI